MGLKSVPDLPRLIFGPIAYFVAPANEKHTFCTPQTIKNHQKSAKNASNASAPKKEGLQGRLLEIFDHFVGPQGGPKIIKNQKSAFQKSIDKKDGKKRGNTNSPWSSAAAFAQPKESKIPLRKALAKNENQSQARQHSRRSAADCCSLTRGPPHSTSPLALADVWILVQNLDVFANILPNHLQDLS